MKPYLVICCVAGIVIPYWFAMPFFLIHGPNFQLFAEEIFATRISSFFAADLILSSVIFLSWSRRDARDKKIAGWWIVLVSNLVVGLSLALPLYLLKRLNAARTQEQAGTLAAGPAIN
jgi:Terpene cyclase DEP1